jgi:hypothetical protein
MGIPPLYAALSDQVVGVNMVPGHNVSGSQANRFPVLDHWRAARDGAYGHLVAKGDANPRDDVLACDGDWGVGGKFNQGHYHVVRGMHTLHSPVQLFHLR